MLAILKYIAVNNGGLAGLRLFKNAVNALTIDHTMWYDVFCKIGLKAKTIKGRSLL